MSVSDAPPLHPAVGPLSAWLGTFEGEGRGDYPTIDPFRYRERVVFGHVGKPFLAYRQRTWHPQSGAPMHAEAGYLRLVAGDGDGQGPIAAEWVLAHPTGIAEVIEGTLEVDGTSVVLDLASTTVAPTATAKDVQALRRRYVLDGDTLGYDLWMAHADTPLTHHLAAVLHRVEDRGA